MNVQTLAHSGGGALTTGTPHDLRTAITVNQRSVFRLLFGLRVNTGGLAEGIRFDIEAAACAITFAKLENFDVRGGSSQPQATVSQLDGTELVVELPVPMQVRKIKFSSAGTVELYRMDGDVFAKEFTKSEPNNTGFSGDFTDMRFGLKRKSGSYQSIPPASLQDVIVTSFPTSARIGLAAVPEPGEAPVPNFFFVIPGEVGRPDGPSGSAPIGEQLATALQQHFDTLEPPYPQHVDLLLVAESDAPCRLTVASFAIPYGLLRTSFRALLLRAADVIDADALATRLREASTPLTAYLRSKLSTDSRNALERALGKKLPAGVLEKMLKELNASLQGEAFYTPARFAGITLKPETLAAATATPTGVARTRVNRLLLEEALPGEIAPIAPAGGDEKEVLSAQGALSSLDVRVDVPRPITIRAATIRLEGDLRSDAPGAAAASSGNGNGSAAPAWDAPIPDQTGFCADGTRAVATSLAPDAALAASGVALAISLTTPNAELIAELREDRDGMPSGRVIAAGSASVARLDRPAWVLFAFPSPAVVAAAPCWIVLRSAQGGALWLAAEETGVVRIGDPIDKGWTDRGEFTGLAPLHQLWTKATSGDSIADGDVAGDVGGRLRVRIGSSVLTPGPDSNAKTRVVDVKNALQSYLAGVTAGQVAPTPIRVLALGKGNVTVYPPEIEYDL